MSPQRIVLWALLLFTGLVAGAQASPEPQAPRIAIVIDDLGYRKDRARQLAQMPYPITMAVIPGSPHDHYAAQISVEHGQELILHVPMETLGENRWEQGLTTQMDYLQFMQSARNLFDQFPHIEGINNHGGSRLTADKLRMEWLMPELAWRELYFLDSRTTRLSAAAHAAQKFRVPHASRDVFLDNTQTEAAIAKQFDRLRKIALQHGEAIAIGHPHPETLAQLEKQLPALIDEGFELAFCSRLLRRYSTSK